jgi:hypothetical protein
MGELFTIENLMTLAMLTLVLPMAKSTFYFVIAVLVLIDFAQSRYQKKLNIERQKVTPAAQHA